MGNPILKALIVDDEPLARKEMRFLLRGHSDFSVEWEAKSVADARKILFEAQPDVVFLDIHLRGVDGFELLPFLHEDTDVVFVTAYDAYAVRAFEVNALDYLTKPVFPKRLESTLNRLRKKANSVEDTPSIPTGRYEPDDKILISTTKGRMFIDCRSIAAVISLGGNYTVFRTTHQTEHLVRKTMKHWAEILPRGLFLRIHRNCIINTLRIRFLKKSGPRCWTLFLECDDTSYSVNRDMLPLIRELVLQKGA